MGCRDDVWFARSEEYRVWRSLAGDTTVVFTLEGVRPAAVDEDDRDELRATFERYPNPALMADHLRALPENKPVIAGLFVDGTGNVFVSRKPRGSTRAQPSTYSAKTGSSCGPR